MNNSTFKYSYLNFDNGRIKNEIITGVLPPSYASCSSLIFFPPWPSFSSRVFAFWQSSKRLNCCSTRYHIVLRNLSFSPFPPLRKLFCFRFIECRVSAVCHGCIDHVPRFRTDRSIELSKRLWVFSSTRYFVRRCFRCYWLTHEIREENAARIKIATSSMMIEILLKWLALVF